MKKFVFSAIFAGTIVVFASQSCGQDPVFAPPHIYTNGAGGVSPPFAGQMLEVGRTYEMVGIPDPGFVFSSWQLVDLFTFSVFTSGPDGEIYPPTISTVPSPNMQYITTPTLSFTMEPVEVILDIPNSITITHGIGWQVNFEAVPEPACLALTKCALTVVAFMRRAPAFSLPSQ